MSLTVKTRKFKLLYFRNETRYGNGNLYKDLLFVYLQPRVNLVRIRKTSLFWLYNLMTSLWKPSIPRFRLFYQRPKIYEKKTTKTSATAKITKLPFLYVFAEPFSWRLGHAHWIHLSARRSTHTHNVYLHVTHNVYVCYGLSFDVIIILCS